MKIDDMPEKYKKKRETRDIVKTHPYESIVNNALTVFIIQCIINLYVSSAKINAELRKCD